MISLRSKSTHFFSANSLESYHAGTTKAMTSTGKKSKTAGRFQALPPRFYTSLLARYVLSIVKHFFFIQAGYLHLLENQSRQEKTSCASCPILTFENTVLILNTTQDWRMFMSLNILPSAFCCSSRVVAPPITFHCHLGWFNPS